MEIGGKRSSRKAVSSAAASLLMVAVSVAASTLVYVRSVELIGILEGRVGQQTKQQLIMVAYKADASPWELHVRNVGNSTMTIASAYVNGTGVTLAGDLTLLPGTAGKITLDTASRLPTLLKAGTTYTVRVETRDGAIFTYSVMAGRSE